ncbi:hypothetical protein QBC38DRAFT_126295 [Podospora fimiseda]|uniref:Uncharacterized protein n=1 Tax=Podospora fimiseda TaxID=252190 RepID=A0AAN6YLS5_9PEZI|nr:hypothetical protein QBC38DRAFT_126295 [Podospora fimiseda]
MMPVSWKLASLSSDSRQRKQPFLFFSSFLLDDNPLYQWRGRSIFSLIFHDLGCFMYYLQVYLPWKVFSFFSFTFFLHFFSSLFFFTVFLHFVSLFFFTVFLHCFSSLFFFTVFLHCFSSLCFTVFLHCFSLCFPSFSGAGVYCSAGPHAHFPSNTALTPLIPSSATIWLKWHKVSTAYKKLFDRLICVSSFFLFPLTPSINSTKIHQRNEDPSAHSPQ